MLISKFGSAKREEILSAYDNIPEELLVFFEKYNGGETPETSFSNGQISSDIVGFYGWGDVKYSYNNINTMNIAGTTYLPIAFDTFGNQIVVSFDDGKIFFADHEKENSIITVAQNFKEFLSYTSSDIINSKHLKSVEEREKELIGRGKSSNISDDLRDLWRKEIEKYSKLNQELVEI